MQSWSILVLKLNSVNHIIMLVQFQTILVKGYINFISNMRIHLLLDVLWNTFHRSFIQEIRLSEIMLISLHRNGRYVCWLLKWIWYEFRTWILLYQTHSVSYYYNCFVTRCKTIIGLWWIENKHIRCEFMKLKVNFDLSM